MFQGTWSVPIRDTSIQTVRLGVAAWAVEAVLVDLALIRRLEVWEVMTFSPISDPDSLDVVDLVAETEVSAASAEAVDSVVDPCLAD